MLPRVIDPCKRHSSKERAKLRRSAAMLTGNLGDAGSETTFDFRPVMSRVEGKQACRSSASQPSALRFD
jgi:hypothetical protein